MTRGDVHQPIEIEKSTIESCTYTGLDFREFAVSTVHTEKGKEKGVALWQVINFVSPPFKVMFAVGVRKVWSAKGGQVIVSLASAPKCPVNNLKDPS